MCAGNGALVGSGGVGAAPDIEGGRQQMAQGKWMRYDPGAGAAAAASASVLKTVSTRLRSAESNAKRAQK